MARVFLCMILTTLGCAGGGLDAPGDAAPATGGTLSVAELPASGVYDVRVDTISDDCDPVAPQGAFGRQPVFANERGVNVPVPVAPQGGWERFDLATAAGYGYTSDVPHGSTGASGAAGASTFRHVVDLQLLSVDASHAEVSILHDWTVPESGELPSIPSKTCRSSQTATYTLVESCPAPRFRVDGDGSVHCG